MMTEQQIQKSISSGKLQLNCNDAFIHYCHATCLLLAILITTPFYYFNYAEVFISFSPWMYLAGGIASVIFIYWWQNDKLTLRIVPTCLSPEETERVIKIAINEINGIVCAQTKNHIEAKIPTPYSSTSGWGCKVFILLDGKQVLVNAISGAFLGGGTLFSRIGYKKYIDKITKSVEEASGNK